MIYYIESGKYVEDIRNMDKDDLITLYINRYDMDSSRKKLRTYFYLMPFSTEVEQFAKERVNKFHTIYFRDYVPERDKIIEYRIASEFDENELSKLNVR